MKFIDTNVLLYAFGPEDDADTRPVVARRILSGGDVAFSIQVFQEFYVQAIHSRRKQPLTDKEAAEVIETLKVFPMQNNNLTLFRRALEIRNRVRISFWDANILAAGLCLGCEVLLSEDLNHGRDYGGIVVVNPFLLE